MTATGGEAQGCDGALEGEMVYCDSTRENGEYRTTVFVDGEEKIPVRVEIDMRDVLSMGEWKCITCIPEDSVSNRPPCGQIAVPARTWSS